MQTLLDNFSRQVHHPSVKGGMRKTRTREGPGAMPTSRRVGTVRIEQAPKYFEIAMQASSAAPDFYSAMRRRYRGFRSSSAPTIVSRLRRGSQISRNSYDHLSKMILHRTPRVDAQSYITPCTQGGDANIRGAFPENRNKNKLWAPYSPRLDRHWHPLALPSFTSKGQ